MCLSREERSQNFILCVGAARRGAGDINFAAAAPSRLTISWPAEFTAPKLRRLHFQRGVSATLFVICTKASAHDFLCHVHVKLTFAVFSTNWHFNFNLKLREIYDRYYTNKKPFMLPKVIN